MKIKAPIIPAHRDKVDLQELQDGEYRTLQVTDCTVTGAAHDYVIVEGSIFSNVRFCETKLYRMQTADTRFKQCDLSNAAWEDPIFHRVEFIDSRLMGFQAVSPVATHLVFRDCNLQFASMRFGEFKQTLFEGCNLSGADFQGSDLTGAVFSRCDLRGARLFQAKLKDTDFRTSKVEGLQLGPADVQGAIFEPLQAVDLVHLLGVQLKAASISSL